MPFYKNIPFLLKKTSKRNCHSSWLNNIIASKVKYKRHKKNKKYQFNLQIRNLNINKVKFNTIFALEREKAILYTSNHKYKEENITQRKKIQGKTNPEESNRKRPREKKVKGKQRMEMCWGRARARRLIPSRSPAVAAAALSRSSAALPSRSACYPCVPALQFHQVLRESVLPAAALPWAVALRPG